MSEMQFNIRGKTVSADQVKRYMDRAPPKSAASPPKRVSDRSVAKISMGFLVLGYSPEQMAQAEREHEAMAAAHRASLRKNADVSVPARLGPFDADAYMRKAKPKRIRSKPYGLSSAADACKELAEKAGWLRVTVEEVLKA